MNHLWMNEKETFAAMTAAYSQELQAALCKRRAVMDSSWDALGKEWAIGITTLMSSDRCVLQLNVAGLHLNVRHIVLESLHGKKNYTLPHQSRPWQTCLLALGLMCPERRGREGHPRRGSCHLEVPRPHKAEGIHEHSGECDGISYPSCL